MSVEPTTERPQPAEEGGRTLSRRQLLAIAGGGVVVAAGAGTFFALGGDSTDTPPAPETTPPTTPPSSAAPAANGERRLAHPFWTTALPADAPLAATSADYSARLAYQAGMGLDTTPVSLPYDFPYNITISTSDFSLCIYQMPADWPRTKVFSNREKTGLQEVLDAGVPVPDPADLPDGTVAPEGTDGAVIILQGNELWELWQFAPGGPSGYEWSCEQGGHMTDYHTHPGWWSGSATFGGGESPRVAGYDWGVSASGQSYLGGILTAEDYVSDAIRHPLPLSLPITGSGASTPTHLLPATRYDEANFTNADDAAADAYRLPEGARFRLPASFDIEGWVAQNALPEAADDGSTADVLRKILVCLRDYGLFIAESAGVVGFSGEHEKVFGTRYHPFSAEERPQWGNFGQQVPWSSLVQVEPPQTDISVPQSA